MSMHIRIAPRRAIPSNELCEMHLLRARVFRGRLGWEVPVLSGMEIDGYDALEPRYMLMRDDATLRGCWRLLPTEGPYMLKDSFPQLLDGQVAPSDPQIWELSRFASVDFNASTTSALSQFSSELTMKILHEAIACAAAHGAKRLITVSPIGIERLLRRTGVHAHRAGPPMIIDGHPIFACWIELDPTGA